MVDAHSGHVCADTSLSGGAISGIVIAVVVVAAVAGTGVHRAFRRLASAGADSMPAATASTTATAAAGATMIVTAAAPGDGAATAV
jgi:hypothetical protein